MFNTNLKKVSSTGALLLLLLLAGACNLDGLPPAPPPAANVQAGPTPEPVDADTSNNILRLLYWQAPTILNPHLSAASPDWGASRITYEPLASYDKDGNLIPFLAAEIPSLENGDLAEDGTSVTWRLRQEVKWSDGQPFTAADVLFTYQYISNPAVGSDSKPAYDAVESVEEIDDYTIKVNFKDVNPAWSLPFVGVQGMILPRHIFAEYNGPNARSAPANELPVGTGPYQVLPPGIKPQEVLFLGSELVETNKIVFVPNPYFREKDQDLFSRVELRGGGIVTEAARQVLQTGEIHFAWNLQVDAQTLDELEAAEKGKAIPVPGSFVEQMVLNFTDPNRRAEGGERSSLEFAHPFLSDPQVRQAISLAIDREAIVALYGRGGSPTSNLLVSPANYASPNTSYEFNLDQAAALLDEAGWTDTDGDGIRDKDGVKMRMVFQTSENPLRQQTQQIVQKSLQDIGFEVDLKVIPTSTFFSSDPTDPNTAAHFYADLQEFNDGNPNPDPGSYMQYWVSDQIPQKANGWTGNNLGRWRNSTYDDLYRQSTTEIDPLKRSQIFIQMNDLLINDVAVIPLVHRARVIGVSSQLAGVDPTPWDAELWNIKDWRLVSP